LIEILLKLTRKKDEKSLSDKHKGKTYWDVLGLGDLEKIYNKKKEEKKK